MPTDLPNTKLTIQTILREAYQHMQGFKLTFWRGMFWISLPIIITIALHVGCGFLLFAQQDSLINLPKSLILLLCNSIFMIYLAYLLLILPMLLAGLEKLSLARITGKCYPSRHIFNLLALRYAKKFIPLSLLYLVGILTLKANLIDYPWLFWPLFFGLFSLFYFHRLAIIDDASISLRRTLYFSWLMFCTYGLKLLGLLSIQLGLLFLSFSPAFVFFFWGMPTQPQTLHIMILLSLTSLSGLALCWLVPWYYCIKATFYHHAMTMTKGVTQCPTSIPLNNLS